MPSDFLNRPSPKRSISFWFGAIIVSCLLVTNGNTLLAQSSVNPQEQEQISPVSFTEDLPTTKSVKAAGPHGKDMPAGAKCPVTGLTSATAPSGKSIPAAAKTGATANNANSNATNAQEGQAYTNQDWWPNKLKLGVLHQNSSASNPMGADFDYATGVQKT